ncbi:MAG: hypothetical protein ACLQU1_25320 [Bryobacteraceae bacterium]
MKFRGLVAESAVVALLAGVTREAALEPQKQTIVASDQHTEPLTPEEWLSLFPHIEQASLSASGTVVITTRTQGLSPAQG